MARIVKRSLWPTFMLLVVAGALFGAFVLPGMWNHPQAKADSVLPASATSVIAAETAQVQASPKRPPLSLEKYEQVQALRQELALTNIDLASMGCTREQTEAVLEGLLAATEQQQASLTAAQTEQALAERDLRQHLSQMHTGVADASAIDAIPQLRERLARTRVQVQQVKQRIGDAATTALYANQQQIRQAALTNMALGVPHQYRYVPGLTQADAKALRRGERYEVRVTPEGQTQRIKSAAAPRLRTASLAAVPEREKAAYLESIDEVEAQVLPLPAELINVVDTPMPETPSDDAMK